MDAAKAIAMVIECIEDCGVITIDAVIDELIKIRKYRIGQYSMSRLNIKSLPRDRVDTSDTVEMPKVSAVQSLGQTPTGQFKAMCHRAMFRHGQKGSK